MPSAYERIDEPALWKYNLDELITLNKQVKAYNHFLLTQTRSLQSEYTLKSERLDKLNQSIQSNRESIQKCKKEILTLQDLNAKYQQVSKDQKGKTQEKLLILKQKLKEIKEQKHLYEKELSFVDIKGSLLEKAKGVMAFLKEKKEILDQDERRKSDIFAAAELRRKEFLDELGADSESLLQGKSEEELIAALLKKMRIFDVAQHQLTQCYNSAFCNGANYGMWNKAFSVSPESVNPPINMKAKFA